MSGLAQAPAPVAPPAGRPATVLLDDLALRALVLRTIAFAALAGYAAAHWAALVQDAPGGRVASVVLVATVAGVLMSLAGRAAGGRGILASALAAVLALGTIWVSFLAIGLPAEMLPPGGWSELGELVDRGIGGLQTAHWPYAGGDADVRLTLLLAIPVAVAPAAALAFWPDERLQPVLRTQALILLLVLYGVGVTERAPASPLLDGTVLLALIAAWLWLPQLRLRQALAAGVTVAAAALVALPLAAALDADKPWIDYEEWRWGEAAVGSQTFDWDHSYGPIDWPREGSTVLRVRSDEGHYWKAETLNRFDGSRWTTGPSLITRGAFDIPAGADPGWHERLDFSVGEMKGRHIVGAGTIYDVDVEGELAIVQRDGTARTVEDPLEEGTRYDVDAYVPDPSARQMRAAPQRYDDAYAGPTFFSLPSAAGRSGEPPQDADFREGGVSSGQLVSVGLWRDASLATPDAVGRIGRSPYGRTYELARSLAAGQATVYDVVKRIELHLQQNYRYSENPPERPYPLSAFLFRDRAGYCQQFSGAMALMLRMNGIPARVAAGFSPGLRDEEKGEYRVRDLDAHSWVEVYFPRIGWVPFDPTPALAPAESQAGGQNAASAARGDDRDTGESARAAREEREHGGPAAGDARDDGFDLALWALPALLLLSLAAAALVYGRRERRRRAATSGTEAELEELRTALRRLGYDVPAGLTLLALERRLAGAAGPAASRYVRLLRERRFAAPGRRSSGGLDRRALRRALSQPLGRLGWLRGFLALPPRPFGPPL